MESHEQVMVYTGQEVQQGDGPAEPEVARFANGQVKTGNFDVDKWHMSDQEMQDYHAEQDRLKLEASAAGFGLGDAAPLITEGSFSGAVAEPVYSDDAFEGRASEFDLARDRSFNLQGDKISVMLKEHGEAITRGLDEREAELALQENQLREVLETQGAGSSKQMIPGGLLGAALHLFKTNPQAATRADMFKISAQRQSLQATRRQITAAHENFSRETKACDDSLRLINLEMSRSGNPLIEHFINLAGEIAASDGVTKGHVYGRVNDPMDADKRLMPLRETQEKIANDLDWKEKLETFAGHNLRAVRASRVLTDLINNEGIMSEDAHRVVAAAAENVATEINTTELPIKGVNAHPENSHLKESVQQMAEISQKIAEAIMAAIKNLVSDLKGKSQEPEGPGIV